MKQLDLFDWAETRRTAKILDWSEPFAKRVMERLHEYDDDWNRPKYHSSVVTLDRRNKGAA